MRAWIIGPVVGMVLGAGAFAVSASVTTPAGQVAPPSDTYADLELFAEVLARVQSDYVKPVEDRAIMEAAIDGMLQELDPHSGYLSPDDFRQQQTNVRGEYGGLGIEIVGDAGYIRVIAPIDDTPASRAGIRAGDFLVAIDGESIYGLTSSEAVEQMRGTVGTTITVTVAREGEEPFDVQLTREVIRPRVVTARVEGGDVGVIRVSTFNNENVGQALNDAFDQVRREAGGRLRGIVLDLRNNPGGLLDQAVAVSDALLDGGEVVSTRGRDPRDIQRFNARRGELMPGVPVVILINEGSASASEIVAGAAQDRGRALVLGMTSFGKGSVQTVIPLRGGREGALRLTTARYYTPAGRSIQETGIEPDMEVAARRIEERPRPAALARLSEGALPNAIRNETGARRRGEHVPDEMPPEGWDEDKDFQLERAMQVIREGQVAARIRAGASLVQLYSALVYEGPGLAARINRGLKALLERDGFATLSEAVGAG
jgi:carboxyl-terminal processing protease